MPYQAFLCADDEYVMVGAFTRNFWQNLCKALDRTEWMTDSRFATNSARLKNRDQLVRELEIIFREKPREDWLAVLEAADVPSSPVLELHDAVATEQAKANKSIVTLPGDGRSIGVVQSPIRAREWGEAPRAMAPGLGQDTACVLRAMGLSDEAIEDLEARGIVANAKVTN